MSWQLTLVGLLVMPIIIVASRKFQRDSNAAYLDVRENIGQNLSTLQEGIAGVRVIQAYAREPEQRAASSSRTGACTTRTSTACGCRPGTSGSSRPPGCWRRRSSSVSAAGCSPTARCRSADHHRRAALRAAVRAGAAALAAVQHRAVVGGALNKLFGILDTEPDVQDGPDDLPAER
jgi:ATP-binding cassette subfamily B protein